MSFLLLITNPSFSTVRFFESVRSFHLHFLLHCTIATQGRIKWMSVLGHKIGGPSAVEALLKGKGIALILKSIEVRFRRPVTYPDTVALVLFIDRLTC